MANFKQISHRIIAPYCYLLPSLLLLSAFLFLPLIMNIQYSFYDFKLLIPAKFIGFANYIALFHDEDFWASIITTLKWVGMSAVLPGAVGLILALLIEYCVKGRFFSGVARTIFFMPVMMSLVSVGLLWSLIYDPMLGLLNALLRLVGLSSNANPVVFLGDPKTVDNDLVETDHCPGFGSVARWMAIAMRDMGRDTESGATTTTSIAILEAMGRDSGWITGATVLAKEDPDDAPHLIYLPEVAFDLDTFLNDVQRIHDRLGYVLIVVSEGIRDQARNLLTKSSLKDAFGHVQLGGVGAYLARTITDRLKIKARANIPGTLQRASILGASQSDLAEAYLVGHRAVKYAVDGKSGSMVALVRESDTPYACTTGVVPLEKVANAKKIVPADYITPEGNFVNAKFVQYVKPLAGDLLPSYMRFKKYPVGKLLEEYQR